MTLDADLNLLVCEHVTSYLVRERPGSDSEREILAFHYEGKYLNSPNDVCVRSDGTIYFSDPWYGRMPGFGIERERELGWQGVFMIPPGGGQNELRLVVAQDEFEMPNGLCFSPDESLLYINDTPGALHQRLRRRCRRDDLQRPPLRGGHRRRRPRERRPRRRDEVRRAGQHLGHGPWRCLGDLSAEGEHLGVVGIPESVGNLTWGGPDWHTLFVPASTSVYTVTDEGRAPPRALHALRRKRWLTNR